MSLLTYFSYASSLDVPSSFFHASLQCGGGPVQHRCKYPPTAQPGFQRCCARGVADPHRPPKIEWVYANTSGLSGARRHSPLGLAHEIKHAWSRGVHVSNGSCPPSNTISKRVCAETTVTRTLLEVAVELRARPRQFHRR